MPSEIPLALTRPVNSLLHWKATKQVTAAYTQPPSKITTAPLVPKRVPKIARLAKLLGPFGVTGVVSVSVEEAEAVEIASKELEALLSPRFAASAAGTRRVKRRVERPRLTERQIDWLHGLRSEGDGAPAPRKSNVFGLD